MPVSRLVPFAAALVLFLLGANTASHATAANFNFRAVTEADLKEVRAAWAKRDLAPRDVSIAYENEAGAHRVRIYRHRVGNNIHYGAVVTPVGATTTLPIVVMLDGLNQTKPWMDLEKRLARFQGNAVWVVPGFRGRDLRFKGKSYASEGDFCDAYDGATDDAIALTNVVVAEVPLAGTKVLAIGYSRGGNVAMLMGMRDARVDTVVAAAGPMDFHRQEVADRYGTQYQCQYFTGLTASASRQRMLASSPLYFELPPKVMVHLMQGDADDVVPPWNATEMFERLRAQKVNVTLDVYPGGTHASTVGSANFQKRWREYVAEFIGTQ